MRDPAFDPMVAPTRAGLHPHLLRSGVERRGEHSGYEGSARLNSNLGDADVMLAVTGRHQTNQVEPTRQANGDIVEWATEHPFLVAGALVGAAWLYVKATDGETRSNPAPAPAQAPVIVMGTPFAGPMPAATTPTPSAAPAEASESKQRRRRRTSQARDAAGHYLPAGTRKKAVTEGEK